MDAEPVHQFSVETPGLKRKRKLGRSSFNQTIVRLTRFGFVVKAQRKRDDPARYDRFGRVCCQHQFKNPQNNRLKFPHNDHLEAEQGEEISSSPPSPRLLTVKY